MYQVPQHIGNKKIFIVQRSEISGRLDAQYYNMSVRIPNSIKLSSFAYVKGGKRIPKGYSYSDKETPYYYLRVADIDNDNEISFDSMKRLDEDVYNILHRYEMQKGELAISIAGTIGKICYLSKIPSNHRVILTENCAKIVLKDENVLNVKYLEILFKMPFIQKQLELNYIQTTIPKLGIDKILSINFPQIPNLGFQENIVDYYTNAYNQKIQKEAEAQQLLDSINTYLLKELNITLPEIKTDLNNRIFRVNRSEIENRLDPFYIKRLDSDIQSAKYEKKKLGDISILVKGNSLTSKEIKQGTIPVIAGGQSIPYYHNTSNFHGNIITVSSSGAYAGHVWYHNYPIYATDCTVVFSNNENYVKTQYIFEIMKLQQKKIFEFQSGAAQPHVYPDNLKKISIPIPPLSKQQEIVSYICAIRQQAKQLQEKGKAVLENAKKEVEQMIIG